VRPRYSFHALGAASWLSSVSAVFPIVGKLVTEGQRGTTTIMEVTPLSSAGCRAAVWRWITYPPRFRERVAPITMKLKMMTGLTFLVVEK
jgi:hypothetical protein